MRNCSKTANVAALPNSKTNREYDSNTSKTTSSPLTNTSGVYCFYGWLLVCATIKYMTNFSEEEEKQNAAWFFVVQSFTLLCILSAPVIVLGGILWWFFY